MKIYKILAGSLLLLGLASCNNENGNDDNNKNDIKNPAYAQFSLVMANTQNQAKASTSTSDGGTNIGTTEEQTVQNVTIIFSNVEGTVQYDTTFNVNNLTSGGVTSDQEIVYTTPVFEVEEGEYTVYACVNKPSSFNPATPETDLVSAGDRGTITDGIAKDNNFMMTTSMENARANVILKKTVNTENNPLPISLNVDRTAAKISYNTAKTNRSFTFEVTNATTGVAIGNVPTTLTAMNIANRNMTSYAFGRKDGEYVKDPNFDQTDVTDLYAGTTFDDKQDLITGQNPEYPYFYCLENTDKEGKAEKFYTGIFFQAKHEPDNSVWCTTATGVTLTGTPSVNGTFYRFGRLLFANKTDMINYYTKYGDQNALQAVTDLLEGSDENGYEFLTKCVTLRDTYHIDVYYEGHSYYLATIGHTGNGSAATAPYAMQYGVVRNTWYQVGVNDISGLGSVVPESTDEPVDPENANIQVEILINPWNVVINDFNL